MKAAGAALAILLAAASLSGPEDNGASLDKSQRRPLSARGAGQLRPSSLRLREPVVGTNAVIDC